MALEPKKISEIAPVSLTPGKEEHILLPLADMEDMENASILLSQIFLQAVASGALADALNDLSENKSEVGHTHTKSNITDFAHTHPLEDIMGLITALAEKQATLVSGSNIKTVNGNNILGSGNIAIETNGGMPGEVRIWTTDTPPAGWMICDGAEVSRTTYSDLFSIIGTSYGVGDGSTTFNLPNLKGRVIVQHDASQAEFDTLGKTGGAKTHTLTVDEIPSHSHTFQTKINSSNWGFAREGGDYNGGVGSTNNTGGGQAHNNIQPYMTLNYIIAY